jgi:hypothetical protein
VGFGRIGNVDPEYGPKGRNHDARGFFIDMNDRAVETFVLGRARGQGQAEKEETRENDEKSRTNV